MTDEVPALPGKLTIDKRGKIVIEYGDKMFKLKPLDFAKNEYSMLLLTKFLWDESKRQWDAHYQRAQDVSDVKKAFTGIEDTAADNLVRQIHEDLFGGQ